MQIIGLIMAGIIVVGGLAFIGYMALFGAAAYFEERRIRRNHAER